jgi:putative membrane protein
VDGRGCRRGSIAVAIYAAGVRLPNVRASLLFVYLAMLAISLLTTEIRPLDTLLLHLPTFVALALAVWHGLRRPLTTYSYGLVFAFLTVHLVGSHYLYSEVPYDDWWHALTGTTLTEQFAFERNHFDRLVHFLFGLLLARPICELLAQWLPLSRLGGIGLSILVISFLSLVYELIEWGIAATLSPETAENYNGQQGDVFDAQKDMALALAGNLLSGGVLAGTAFRGSRD